MHIFRAHKSMPRAIYLGYHKRRCTSKKSKKMSPIATAIAIMNALITLALAIAIMNALTTLAIAIMNALTTLAIAIMNALTKLAIAIMNALTKLAIAIINALMVLTITAKKPLNFTPKPDGLQEAWLPRVLRKGT